ncbi:serpin family protein [bacterium]|nr:serpin family protein [bacterium]
MSNSNIITVLFILIVAGSLVAFSLPRNNTENVTQNDVARAYAEFSFDLYQKEAAAHKNKNIFISPASVALALAMTTGGSDGETEKAMLQTLKLKGINREDFKAGNKRLIVNLLQKGKEVKLSIANSIWLNGSIKFNEEFKSDTEEYFLADLFPLTTAKPINAWVKEKTNGKINDIIDMVSTDDIAYLVNAIYFKGNWTKEFDKKETKPELFYPYNGKKITVDMMKQKNRFNYLKTETFEAVTIPYGDGKTSISLFLPNKDSNLDTLYKDLSYKSWKLWESEFRKQEGTIEMPKLEIEFKSRLNNSLSALGMEIAFSPGNADFSRMCKIESGLNVYVSKVLHKTFLKIDEKGTEAAAATAVGITLTSAGHDNIKAFYLIFNRPYFLIIKDNSNGLPLFMGSVVDPPPSNSH